MKNKPTSAKKHKGLRRRRKVDWGYAREQMNKREEITEKAADDFIDDLGRTKDNDTIRA